MKDIHMEHVTHKITPHKRKGSNSSMSTGHHIKPKKKTQTKIEFERTKPSSKHKKKSRKAPKAPLDGVGATGIVVSNPSKWPRKIDSAARYRQVQGGNIANGPGLNAYAVMAEICTPSQMITSSLEAVAANVLTVPTTGQSALGFFQSNADAKATGGPGPSGQNFSNAILPTRMIYISKVMQISLDRLFTSLRYLDALT